jgi:hypothetical protein
LPVLRVTYATLAMLAPSSKSIGRVGWLSASR